MCTMYIPLTFETASHEFVIFYGINFIRCIIYLFLFFISFMCACVSCVFLTFCFSLFVCVSLLFGFHVHVIFFYFMSRIEFNVLPRLVSAHCVRVCVNTCTYLIFEYWFVNSSWLETKRRQMRIRKLLAQIFWLYLNILGGLLLLRLLLRLLLA